MLGPIKFRQQGVAAESEVGLATGLAWTEIGGEVLQIEATLTKGSWRRDADRQTWRRDAGVRAGGVDLHKGAL